jgi:hypothetical protein
MKRDLRLLREAGDGPLGDDGTNQSSIATVFECHLMRTKRRPFFGAPLVRKSAGAAAADCYFTSRGDILRAPVFKNGFRAGDFIGRVTVN